MRSRKRTATLMITISTMNKMMVTMMIMIIAMAIMTVKTSISMTMTDKMMKNQSNPSMKLDSKQRSLMLNTKSVSHPTLTPEPER